MTTQHSTQAGSTGTETRLTLCGCGCGQTVRQLGYGRPRKYISQTHARRAQRAQRARNVVTVDLRGGEVLRAILDDIRAGNWERWQIWLDPNEISVLRVWADSQLDADEFITAMLRLWQWRMS